MRNRIIRRSSDEEAFADIREERSLGVIMDEISPRSACKTSPYVQGASGKGSSRPPNWAINAGSSMPHDVQFFWSPS